MTVYHSDVSTELDKNMPVYFNFMKSANIMLSNIF